MQKYIFGIISWIPCNNLKVTKQYSKGLFAPRRINHCLCICSEIIFHHMRKNSCESIRYVLLVTSPELRCYIKLQLGGAQKHDRYWCNQISATCCQRVKLHFHSACLPFFEQLALTKQTEWKNGTKFLNIHVGVNRPDTSEIIW